MAFLVVAPLSALLLVSSGPNFGVGFAHLAKVPDALLQQNVDISQRSVEVQYHGSIDQALSNASAKEDESVSSADSERTEHESAVDFVRVVNDVPPSSDARVLVQVLAEPSTSVPTTFTVGWSIAAVGLLGMAALIARSQDSDEGKPSQFAIHVAEFLGTFMLVFSVGCNVLVGDKTWGVASIACTLMVMIYALGGVSGGNFNPAVSLTLWLSEKMPMAQFVSYSCVQLAAGIVAALTYSNMLGKTTTLGPKPGFHGGHAAAAEIIYTFMLTFCVLNTACSTKHGGKDQFFGLAIAFCVVAGGYGGGAISGGCFNPAVALGIDASSSHLGFGWCLPYAIFEAIGAFVAACSYRCCRPDDFDRYWAPGRDYCVATKLLSEFLGTYILVVTVGLNSLAASPAAVYSIAASLMCMIFALGTCSGAHFNPAVTVAILGAQRDKISVADAIAYVVSQLFGGICAGVTFVVMYSGKTVPLEPKAQGALIGEFVFTFVLAFVVLSVATVKNPLSQYFGLAIGSCVTAGGLAIGSLSGGALNPAVAAGLGCTSGHVTNVLLYSVVQLCGGLAAASLFRVTHEVEYSGK